VGGARLPYPVYLPSRTKWCTLQLKGQIHSPYLYSIPICALWLHYPLYTLRCLYRFLPLPPPRWEVQIRRNLHFSRYSLPIAIRKAVSETTNRWIESVNRERESVATLVFLGFIIESRIDDNFRISNNLGLDLAANISAALAIQPVRDREIEII